MPSFLSTPNKKSQKHDHHHHHQLPSFLSLLRHTPGGPGGGARRNKPSSGGLLKLFKLFPLLTSGCKVVALLGGRHRRALIADHATIGTLFGPRRGRITLAVQEDPHSPPFFVLELPIQAAAFHKEMEHDILRIALECDTKTHKKKLLDEFVWAVYCNGRKVGYSIRRKQLTEEEAHVMQMLRGVSMGAGMLPSSTTGEETDAVTASGEGEGVTYLRGRFDRVVGSKDSEALYMINPDAAPDGPELSIFFLRAH